jgi:hypothetical protein
MFQENSETFVISMDDQTYVDCPVPNCPATYHKRNTMRQHFNHRHWHHTIIIAEEGLLPQCPRCLLYCSIAHQPRHYNSTTCAKGTLRNQHRLQQYYNEVAEQTTIQISGTDIEKVDIFKYLGRQLSATGNDSTAVKHNLQKARKVWGRISIILKCEGADKLTMTNFYKAVVQSTLLYGSETWVLTTDLIAQLTAFHHRAARYITHRHIRQLPNTEIWVYPDMPRTLEEINLLPITNYIEKRKNTLLKWAQNRPVYLEARHYENTRGGRQIF